MATKTKTAPATPANGVPANATHFELYALKPKKGTNADGKRYSTFTARRCQGAPDADGKVTERWLVAELSPKKVRRRWGPGRYRVRFLTEAGEVVGVTDWTLETPASEQTGAAFEASGDAGELPGAGAPVAGESAAARLRGMAGRLDGAGALELVLLMNDAADRAAVRAREDNERNSERDRNFFAMMMQLHQGGAAAPAAAAATTNAHIAREFELMRREQALATREQFSQLRTELLNNGGDDPDDGTDPPTTAAEAAERAGVAAVEGIGQQMPAVVNEILGALRNWLRSSGTPATPQNMQAVIEAVRAAQLAEAQAQQNGAPEHGSDA